MASGSITSWKVEGWKVETVTDSLFSGSKMTMDGSSVFHKFWAPERTIFKLPFSFICVWLCDPMNCSSPGSFVLGILQSRILDGLLFLTPGDRHDSVIEPESLKSPALAGGFFTTSTTLEASKVFKDCL